MAKSVNKVILVGNIGKQPESHSTSTDNAMVTFSLATSRRTREGDAYVDVTDWHHITAYGKTAEFVSNYLGKGSKVYMEGRIQYRKYTDTSGVERTSTDIIANEVMALDSRPVEGGDTREATSHEPVRMRPPAKRLRGQNLQPPAEETFGEDSELPSWARVGADDVL